MGNSINKFRGKPISDAEENIIIGRLADMIEHFTYDEEAKDTLLDPLAFINVLGVKKAKEKGEEILSLYQAYFAP